MSCRRIRSLLSAFIDSELSGAEMLAIRSHLADCASCSVEFRSIASLKSLLSSLPETKPRRELIQSLQELPEHSPIDLCLLKQQREIRRILGLASAPENMRALQQTSGYPLGIVFALGMLGAWFVVAPMAVAPVAAHFQESRERSIRSQSEAASFQRPTAGLFDSGPTENGYMNDTSFPVASMVRLPERFGWRNSAIPESGPFNGLARFDATPMTPYNEFAGAAPHQQARLYSVDFNASR